MPAMPAKNELAEQVPKIDGNRYYVRGQTRVTRGSKNGLTPPLEHRGRRTTDPELQKSAHNHRCILYCGILENCGSRIHPNPITFDRQVFLITKQFRGEIVEKFYGKLKKNIAEKFDFVNQEETPIRDVFITNLIDSEIQKKFLK